MPTPRPTLFLSCCAPAHPRLLRLLALASERPDLDVLRSPEGGDDPRFSGWYERGLPETLARADRVLVVETPGWDSSTWMASELTLALTRHPGRVWFWWLSVPRAISWVDPAELRALPADLDAAQVLGLLLSS